MPLARVSKSVSLVVAALLLSACGLGDGSRPESLEIRRSATSTLLGSQSSKAFVCFSDQLQVIATDSDGRLGDFTQRVIWTSSNPAVARISNGDIQLPSDPTKAYASGVVIPQAPGTTTITARFSELSTSYELTVEEPTAMRVEPAEQSLAKYSTAPLKLVAEVDGYTRDATALARWTIVEAEEDETTTDIASIGSTSGVVAANKTLGTLTAKANLDACPAEGPVAALAADLTAAVHVRDLASLSWTREFDQGDGTAPPLTIGTTEKFTVTGHFADTEQTQDLSSQIRFESGDTAIAGGTSPANFVLATSSGITTVTPRYPPSDRTDFPTIKGEPAAVTAIERTFQSFVVTPATATVGPFEEQQFRAIATYTDAATQDITRHVLWRLAQDSSAEDLALVSIGSTYTLAGVAIARQIADGEVTITAIRGTGNDAVEQTATLTVDAP